MNYQINVNIKEVVEYSLSDDDRNHLIDFIMYDCMSLEDRKNCMSKLLSDLLETEIEFEKRQNVIQAMNTIIKSIE